MKVFTVTLLFACLASCYGYSYIIPASIKHPGICFYNGHMLQKGDNQMPTTCQNMKCNDDGSILVQGCGRLDLPKCTLKELSNLDKPYPDCCEMTYQCKDDDGNMSTKQWNQLKMGGGTTTTNEMREQGQLDQLEKAVRSEIEMKARQADQEDTDEDMDDDMDSMAMKNRKNA